MAAISGCQADPAETVLLTDDFQTYAGGTRPRAYDGSNFPRTAEDPANGVVAGESKDNANKVLRMYTSPEGSHVESTTDLAWLVRSFSGGPAMGSANVISLQFDYKNLGTAGAVLFLGLGKSGGLPSEMEAVMFSGTARAQRGGFFLRDQNRTVYPTSPDGGLKNLTVGTWYRVTLEIRLGSKTAILTVLDTKTSMLYSTQPTALRSSWDDAAAFDQIVFGGEPGSRAYKFELDNLKVSWRQANPDE